MANLPDTYTEYRIDLPGEGACVVIVLTGDKPVVDAAKHAALGAVQSFREKMRPEPKPCRGCGDR